MFAKLTMVLVVGCVALGLCGSASGAAGAQPGWEVFGDVSPTRVAPGDEATIRLYVYNVGAAASFGEATVTDTLPTGVTATGSEKFVGEGVTGKDCSGSSVVTCSLPTVMPGETVQVIIPVNVAGEPVVVNGGDGVNEAVVQGGGALGVALQHQKIEYGEGETGFGIANFDAWFTNPNGTTDTQAGSHPYALTVAFATNGVGTEKSNEQPSGGDVRTIDVNLPPGIVGNALSAPRCPRRLFDSGFGAGGEGCPANAQVGEDGAYVRGLGLIGFPVYNLVPPPGVAAQFAFSFEGISTFLDARVRSGGDNGISEHVPNVPQYKITFNTTTIWGIPGESSHDWQRRSGGDGGDCFHGCAYSGPVVPFLTLPTSCAAPGVFSIEAVGTWQGSNAVPTDSVSTHNEAGEPVGMEGCGSLVHFNPVLSVSPETSFADTPTGISTELSLPANDVNGGGLANSGLENTTVTLPEGLVINPGQATGLQACQADEENIGGAGAETENEDGPSSCPLASKVGTDEISTPLVPDKLVGNVYILQANPPNLQLLVTASGDGVNLKLPGTVRLNEQTGQLVATFQHTPDAPFTVFKLDFSGGPQAALATPTRCGGYLSAGLFTPWASPFVENATSNSGFLVSSGPGGSSCQWPLPFQPTMTAGATTDQAGGYTDFTTLLARADGQQRIEKLQFKTPEGLLGMIAKVPLCEEPQAAAGTCSSASQIGHTVAEVGPGPYPFVIPQPGAPPAPIYLTGSYEGAPFGLSIAVPIVAGPFNLGIEVVRAKIEVDPHTSQLTISTTAFPKTVKGIPTDIREIDAVIDRPEFMFNPTDCNPMSFTGTATSFEGATAPLSSHFQMGSCRSLLFKPDFTVSTSGKTSRANGASLTAKIVYPTGNLGANQASSQSNINSVKVDLPKQLPSRLTTLQKACSAKIFEANPANCPAASIVGHAKAITPVLPVPIEGPAYFVSHAGEEFPSLIAVLQGYGVTVDLIGSTFINNKTNITSSTFKNVPDVPIASFELNLPQGKYSALAANGNLCKSKLAMPTAFIGQNGAEIHQTTPISVTGCPKGSKKAGKKAKAKRKQKK
jgi:hypothetical protein